MKYSFRISVFCILSILFFVLTVLPGFGQKLKNYENTFEKRYVKANNFQDSSLERLRERQQIEEKLTLLRNDQELIPLLRLDTLKINLLTVGNSNRTGYYTSIARYSEVDSISLPPEAGNSVVNNVFNHLSVCNLIVVAIYPQDFGKDNIKEVLKLLDSLASRKVIILDLFGKPEFLESLRKPDVYKSILVSYDDREETEDLSGQLIFGAIGAKGQLPYDLPTIYRSGTGLTTIGGIRLKYTIPEEINIKATSLLAVDSIVRDGIQKMAFPGCQVLAAKDGKVFFQKSYGHHMYDSVQQVKNTDLFDLASITKISSTLPSVMKLYEEGKIQLSGHLADYLPEMTESNKKDIQLLDILTHQARLLPFIPFYQRTLETENPNELLFTPKYSDTNPIKAGTDLYANKNIRYKPGYFVTSPDATHQIQVANNLYLLTSFRDSIFAISKDSRLLPVKEYKYSDMDFYYLYWMVERLTQKKLDEYVAANFYQKLGATSMGFLPLKRFLPDEIVPTEQDLYFRKQLLRGFVHDPGAAMMGGVCGHAGLFSNANDLAKLMQMYLNKGSYGGSQYFEPQTIDYFTSCPFCSFHNRRGIGFDKPEMDSDNGPTCRCVSAKSYGHTGFTGNITWVDPENGLLYIFLSNRVYPEAGNNKLIEMNIRTKIQEVFTRAISKN